MLHNLLCGSLKIKVSLQSVRSLAVFNPLTFLPHRDFVDALIFDHFDLRLQQEEGAKSPALFFVSNQCLTTVGVCEMNSANKSQIMASESEFVIASTTRILFYMSVIAGEVLQTCHFIPLTDMISLTAPSWNRWTKRGKLYGRC